VSCDREPVGPWEKFERIDHPGGKVTFKTWRGRYLCAEPPHHSVPTVRGQHRGQIIGNRTEIGGWEMWGLTSRDKPGPGPWSWVANPFGLPDNVKFNCMFKNKTTKKGVLWWREREFFVSFLFSSLPSFLFFFFFFFFF
jgi:hypothetical protein